jgi:LmbE family N-acetylglucosaminyl deacetylase
MKRDGAAGGLIMVRYWRKLTPSALALVILGVSWPGICLGRGKEAQANASVRRAIAMTAPTARDRVLVIVPHCDDETMACGGVIAEALRAKAQVRVTFANSGDGFRHAVELYFHESTATPQDYLRMAAQRQQESCKALSHLGLAADRITFLGYPDGSTAPMWFRCWGPDHLYTSPHTRKDHNPYAHSLRPGAPYCARSLIDDLKTVILDFRPTILFCPHPNDDHPDHWALYCCTAAALYEAGMLDHLKLRLFLVHHGPRGQWPTPWGLHRSDPMTPPPDLEAVDGRWESLRLPSSVARRKEQAIGEYHTQLLVMRDFLLNFAKSSEVFEVGSTGRLPAVEPGTIRIDGNSSDWRDIPPVLLNPAGEPTRTDARPGADLERVYAACDGRHLFLRLDLYEPAAADLEYALHVNVLSKGKVGETRSYALRTGSKTPGCDCAIAGRCLELSVPLAAGAETAGIMLGADSRYHSRVLDKTRWVLLETAPRLRQTGGPT